MIHPLTGVKNCDILSFGVAAVKQGSFAEQAHGRPHLCVTALDIGSVGPVIVIYPPCRISHLLILIHPSAGVTVHRIVQRTFCRAGPNAIEYADVGIVNTDEGCYAPYAGNILRNDTAGGGVQSSSNRQRSRRETVRSPWKDRYDAFPRPDHIRNPVPRDIRKKETVLTEKNTEKVAVLQPCRHFKGVGDKGLPVPRVERPFPAGS